MIRYDVVILGAGPAGLAAALSSHGKDAHTLIIERENRLGGILKQCIHDGFGLIRFNERLSGPEYAERYIKMVREANIPIKLSTFVTHVEESEGIFKLTLINSQEGVVNIETKALVLANGCRERTAKQVFIHGTRPAGVYTAGTAQYFVNIQGYLPCKRCVILGSGDIGLIMARRLTLEGAEVLGVYEVKSTPSGLTRNVAQCLNDYDIPLYLSHTITRIMGDDRVEAIEVTKVDENGYPIIGTEEELGCDGVILSVGLIPENEIAQSLDIKIDPLAKGPYVDQNFMTLKKGVFSCGNALHVNDLVDYVSESGHFAGESAAVYSSEQKGGTFIPIKKNTEDFLYVVPQGISLESKNRKIILYFRSKKEKERATVMVLCDGKEVLKKRYRLLKPPEMERLEIDLTDWHLTQDSTVTLVMREGS